MEYRGDRCLHCGKPVQFSACIFCSYACYKVYYLRVDDEEFANAGVLGDAGDGRVDPAGNDVLAAVSRLA